MAVKRGRQSDSDGGEVEYEKLRNERLLENQKRMEELGILSLSKSLSESVRSTGISGRGSPRSLSSTPRAIVPVGPARRSSRLSGSPVVSYSEFRKKGESKEKTPGRKASLAGTGGFQPEIYTEEDEKLLGSAKDEWKLFVDGYDGKGVRIYDPVRGRTCHQCRQKTMGRRTSCSNCQSLHGQFCGDCLYMRYGENVIEANENENWECPVCRGICNCSFCRLKRGWTPTGSLYRRITSLGYKSVAHYLILTRRGEDDDKVVDGKDHKEAGVTPPPLKPVSDKSEIADLAPKDENSEQAGLPTSPVVEESKIPEKVPEIQSTLLSAGWRSRRAVSSKLNQGQKPNTPDKSDSPVQPPNAGENEAASEPPKRRGRPPKNRPTGKAAFYGSAPMTRLEANAEPVDEEKPEPVGVEQPVGMAILVLDSDTEDSQDRRNSSNTESTLKQRLRRRVTTS